MDIDYFEQAGALLFGNSWVIPMARALGVNRRTIYKWKVQAEVPEPVGDKLKEMMAARIAALREHERGFRRAAGRRSIQR